MPPGIIQLGEGSAALQKVRARGCDLFSGDLPAAYLRLLYGLAAFGCWGLVPLYFHALAAVPALEVLAHRIVWSSLFLAVPLTLARRCGLLHYAGDCARRVLRKRGAC